METNVTNQNERKHHLKIVRFHYQAIGKVSQRFFTKLVLADPNYYRVGEIYDIVVMGMPVYFVQLVAIKKLRYYELTDMESFIDLGIPLTEYRQYLMKYLPANIDLKTQEFYFCLFEHVTPGKEIMDEPKFNQNHKSKIVNQQS